jgi:7-carboxy-7-deazaguanine synthase
MIISEIFYSLQGEGFLAGVPSLFIRLAGCPLYCKWCDTKYARDEQAGEKYTTGEIVEAVKKYQTKYIVITGGEPMIKPNLLAEAELPELFRLLKASGKHITIETAGIAFVPDLPCDLMSISPKLSNSTPDAPVLAEVHGNSRLDIAVLTALLDGYNYQLKFVVDSPHDLEEINQTIETLGNVDLSKVMLMPQAQTRKELLAKSPAVANLCKRTGFTFCQRLQVLLWDGQRGL